MGIPALDTQTLAKNRLLAQLPEADAAMLLAKADAIVIPEGRIFARAGQPATTVYFPDNGLICGVAEMTTGQQVGIGTIGADGFIGVGIVLDISRFAYWSTVLVETAGYRIPAPHFQRAFHDSANVRRVILAYAGRVLVEYARLAACHRIHSQRQRLARWLLTATDRAGQPTLPVTHDVLAQMVGGPRHSITAALRDLRGSGAIDHARGSVNVLSREILINQACECYLKGTVESPAAVAGAGEH